MFPFEGLPRGYQEVGLCVVVVSQASTHVECRLAFGWGAGVVANASCEG